MGQTLPQQHPAVVLRSHYQQVRTLLAIALIAVVALAATVVVLAVDNDGATGAGAAIAPSVLSVKSGNAVESIGEQTAVRRAAVHGKATPVGNGTRYDGGPDEGTRGAVLSQQWGTRYDGGPEEGTTGPGH